jgi:nicotinic acid mononucleotide adenylyltransferase
MSSSEFGQVSEEEKAANREKPVNFLYPGSFSPITGAHKSAVEKLLQFGLFRGYSKVNVYIIPATNQYNKASIFKPSSGDPAQDYLSEQARIRFLEIAKSEMTIPANCKVIISTADFKYGAGHYKIDDKVSSGLMPTAFLAVNYNKDIAINGDGADEKLLEDSANFEGADTFLILGADNAYTDIVGWGDPKAILDNIQILVIARGAKPSDLNRMVKTYYKLADGITSNSQKPFEDVVAERNAIYGNDYDLAAEMERKYKQLEFVVPEISSSLLRKIVKDEEINVDEFDTVLTQLRTNDASIRDSDEYIEGNKGNKGNKVKSDKKEYVVGLLTPIPINLLTSTYENNGNLSDASGGSKNRRKTRRINKKRKTMKKRRNYSKRR